LDFSPWHNKRQKYIEKISIIKHHFLTNAIFIGQTAVNREFSGVVLYIDLKKAWFLISKVIEYLQISKVNI
jgi:hypothetical protein